MRRFTVTTSRRSSLAAAAPGPRPWALRVAALIGLLAMAAPALLPLVHRHADADFDSVVHHADAVEHDAGHSHAPIPPRDGGDDHEDDCPVCHLVSQVRLAGELPATSSVGTNLTLVEVAAPLGAARPRTTEDFAHSSRGPPSV
ncbi:MAG: DUF2946 family protein [Phycisphaerales bacterium]